MSLLLFVCIFLIDVQTCVGNRVQCKLNDVYYSRFTELPDPKDFEFPSFISKRQHPVVHSTNIESGVQDLRDKYNIPVTMDDIEFYEKNGYLVFHEFFNTTELNTIRSTLKEYVNNTTIRDDWDNDEFLLSEPNSNELRSLFRVHRSLLYDLSRDIRLAKFAAFILNSDVYITQSRVNFQKEIIGQGFPWHSDFETWYMEDGMTTPRALSAVILLDPVYSFNAGLMGIPGSHKYYVHTINEGRKMSNENWKESLKSQYFGSPNKDQLSFLMKQSTSDNGIEYIGLGKPGTVLFFDSNLMHGSHNNISPISRNTIFWVYNSVDNKLGKPIIGNGRPDYLVEKDPHWQKGIIQTMNPGFQ